MARSFMQLLKAFALGCLSLSAFSGVSQADITDIELKAFPSNYEGKCPYKIIFTGYITVNSPGSVIYHFHRTNYSQEIIRLDMLWDQTMRELTFQRAGTYPVQTSWIVGSTGRQVSGSENIEIMQGQSRVTTPLASFTVQCDSTRTLVNPAFYNNPQEQFLSQLFSDARREVQGFVSERDFQQRLLSQQTMIQAYPVLPRQAAQQQFYTQQGVPRTSSTGSARYRGQIPQTRIYPYSQYPFPRFPNNFGTSYPQASQSGPAPVVISTPPIVPQISVTPYQPYTPNTHPYNEQIPQMSSTAYPQPLQSMSAQSSPIKSMSYEPYSQQASTVSAQAPQVNTMSYQQLLNEGSSSSSIHVEPYQQFVHASLPVQAPSSREHHY